MKTIAATKFKATCLGVIEEVSRTGNPVLITRYGRPVAQLGPPPPEPRPRNWLGMFSEGVVIKGDIVRPALEMEEWEVFRK